MDVHAVTGGHAVALSVRGRRAENQDRVVVMPNVIVLADGIGGHAGGHLAAQAAAAAASSTLLPVTAAQAEHAFGAAAEAVGRVRASDPRFVDAGCTLTVVATRPATGIDLITCVVAHAGDSPAFLVRGEDLTLLTHPHTVSADLVRAGRLTEDQAQTHPDRHTLSRSIGPAGLGDPDVREFELLPGDRVLVASDGLLDVPVRSRLRELATADGSLYGVAESLVRHAALTSSDNITVAMLDPYGDDEVVMTADS